MFRPLRVGLTIVVFTLAACSPPAKVTQPGTPTSPAALPSPATKPSPSALPDPAAWDPRNSVTPGFLPRAIAVIDPQHWVIGGKIECGQPCLGAGEGVLAVTTNGGQSWDVTKRHTWAITHLAVNEELGTVWASASRCHYFLDDCVGRLLRSNDGGRRWAFASTPLINPEFASTRVGFAATGDIRDGTLGGPIAITRDGGATWSRRPGPCHGYQNMPVGFSFPSESDGWLLCGSRDPGAGFLQFKAVYRTIDGGDSWQPTARFSPHGSTGCCLPANGGALGIRMFDDESGYVWTGGGFSHLSRTADGGATWRTVWKDHDGGGTELTSIAWLDPLHAYAIRWRSSFGFHLVRTSDGGRTWSPIEGWPSGPRNDAG